jgi:hypothetical protein
MKKITKVTVTGADDTTDISRLFEIQDKYPFVEYGILVSEKYSLGEGRGRFPSKAWLEKLAEANEKSGMKFLLGEWPEFNKISYKFEDHFDRFQINTHAQYHEIDIRALDILMNFLEFHSQSAIFQIDGVNDVLGQLVKNKYSMRKACGLFDLSHGAGVLPTQWPEIIKDIKCGYAGGLSPENVAEQVEKIIPLVGDNTFWIDAETHLRSDGDRKFDLEKVTKFLEAAKPFVV